MIQSLFLTVLLAPLLLSSCSTLPDIDSTPSNQVTKATGSERQSMAELRRKVKSGAPENSISLLTEARGSYKGTEFETEVEQLLAQELLKNKNFTDAGLAYLRAARSNSDTGQQINLCKKAGGAFQTNKDWDRLAKAVDYCLGQLAIPVEKSLELKEFKVSSQEVKNASPVELARSYVDLTAQFRGEKEAQYRAKSLQTLEVMGASELQQVINDSEFGFLRGHAAYRLAQIQISQQKTNEAKQSFAVVIQYLPETELAELSQRQIEKIDMANQVNPSTVGAILPLSGKHGALGERVLRGLQMGLGLDGESYSPIKLAVIDSEGNPDLARRGVEKLVQEDNVIGIVGSLLSKTANAVADQCQVLEVPNIGLSQKAGVTDIGNNVFRYGLTSQMQVRFLVKKAMTELGIRRFAIIYPNDKFGTEYANLFWDEVLARGGEIRGAQIYDPEEIDFSGPIQRLVGTFYQEERLEELRWRAKKNLEKNKPAKIREKVEEDLLPPATDFEALFVADGIRPLGQISAMLAYHGVKGVKVLGTNLWNNPALTKRISNFSNPIIFVDGSSVASPAGLSSFEKQFKKQFGQEAGPFEVQGFETGIMIGRALSDHVRSRADFRNKLSSLSPFLGVNGTISRVEEREFGKQLSLFTLDDHQIKPFSFK